MVHFTHLTIPCSLCCCTVSTFIVSQDLFLKKMEHYECSPVGAFCLFGKHGNGANKATDCFERFIWIFQTLVAIFRVI